MPATNGEKYHKNAEIVQKIFKTPNLQGFYDELENADMFAYDDIDYAESLELQPANALTVMNLKDCDWDQELRIAPLSQPIQARNRSKIQLSAGWCPLLAKLVSIDAQDYTIDVRSQQSLALQGQATAGDPALKQLDESVVEGQAVIVPAGDFGSTTKLTSTKNVDKLNLKVVRTSSSASTLSEQYNFSISAHVFQNFLTLYHCDIYLATHIKRPLRSLTVLAPKLSTHVQPCIANNSNVGAPDKLALPQLRPVAYSSTEFATKCKFTTNINEINHPIKFIV